MTLTNGSQDKESSLEKLRAAQIDQGAKFSSEDKNGPPLHYGDPISERYEAEKGVGLVDLTGAGLFMVQGPERLSYLDNILTNDLSKTLPGQGQYASLLSPKGRMITDLCVYIEEATIWVQTTQERRLAAFKTLDKYLLASNADLKDHSDDYFQFAIISSHIPKLPSSIFGEIEKVPSNDHDHVLSQFEGEPIWIARELIRSIQGFLIWIKLEKAASLWEAVTSTEGFQPIGSRGYDQFLVSRFIPLFSRDLTERSFPLEVGLEASISYDKGCFIGQETISMMKSRGSPNRYLVQWESALKEVPTAGTFVFSGEDKIGTITSATSTENHRGTVGMALLGSRFAEPDAEYTLTIGENEINIKVLKRVDIRDLGR